MDKTIVEMDSEIKAIREDVASSGQNIQNMQISISHYFKIHTHNTST
jgi:hypothetical protein